MKIKISAESTIDLPKSLLEEYDISTLPFQVTLGDNVYYDGEISSEEIINFANETKILPKTNAINEYTYTEYFTELLKDSDYVIHFCLSSGLSCACNNAKMAAKNSFDGKVFVVDTMSLSTGIALLAITAVKLAKEGLPVNEIVEKVEKRVPFVNASFELKRLDFLYKGGRCSALSYFGANLLKIHPQIIVKDGKMISGKKYRGSFAKVVDSYCKDTLELFNNPDLSQAFVTYTTAEDEIVEIAVKHLKEAGFKRIDVTRAGGTITSHCGENCLGILYINDGGNF